MFIGKFWPAAKFDKIRIIVRQKPPRRAVWLMLNKNLTSSIRYNLVVLLFFCFIPRTFLETQTNPLRLIQFLTGGCLNCYLESIFYIAGNLGISCQAAAAAALLLAKVLMVIWSVGKLYLPRINWQMYRVH